MLVLTNAVINEIISHARTGAPEEVCGLVGGRNETAERVYQVENKLHSPIEYLMDSQIQMKAFKELITDGYELIGLYHSHPESAPQPSNTDLSRAYQNDVRYIIISLANPAKPDLRCYNLQDGTLVEEEWRSLNER